MATVVVATDKFKGSASAEQACEALCAGIRSSAESWRCVPIPLADGGDGTVAALGRAGWRLEHVSVVDARGDEVSANVAIAGESVVVELADICGIARWRGRLRPWEAHTIGLGMAIHEQITRGRTHVLVAVGGSASTDGGLGLLTGLGFRVLDDAGSPVDQGLEGLRAAARIVAPDDIEALLHVTWSVLVDVDAPLLGPTGSSFRFGPQKGLRDFELAEADRILWNWAQVLADYSGVNVADEPGSGAAGGVVAALRAVFDATVVSGFAFVAKQAGLAAAVESADAVVTGEGHLDVTSLTGKVVGGVIELARANDLPTFIVVGDANTATRISLPEVVITLVDLVGDRDRAMSDTAVALDGAGRVVGERLMVGGAFPGTSAPSTG